MVSFLLANIHTVLFIVGLVLLTITVFLVNTIAGLFTLSGILIFIGLLLSITPGQGGR